MTVIVCVTTTPRVRQARASVTHAKTPRLGRFAAIVAVAISEMGPAAHHLTLERAQPALTPVTDEVHLASLVLQIPVLCVLGVTVIRTATSATSVTQAILLTLQFKVQLLPLIRRTVA